MIVLTTTKKSNISTHKNLYYSILAVSFRLIANVFVFWLLARVYDPIIFGQFTFAHSLATTLIVIADFGFDVFLTTEISSKKEKLESVFSNLFSYKVIFTFFTMAGMLSFAFMMNSSQNTKILVFLFSFFLASTTITNFMFALFRGIENLGYEMKVSLIMNLILIGILPILLLMKANIIIIASIFCITRIIGLILAIKYSTKLIGEFEYGAMFQGFTQIRNKMFVYGFHFVFSYIFFQLDTILLLLFKGEYETGIYQSVFKFILLPLAIPEIIMNVLLPVLTRYYGENKEEWIKIGEFLSKTLLLVILPISITLFAYSDQIIKLVYGDQYHSASPVLQIFSLIILVRFLLEPFALMLTTSARQHIRLVTVLFATIINLVLNVLFIPKMGVVGAALVSLITNIFVGLTFVLVNCQVFKIWFVHKRSIILLVLLLVEVPLVFLVSDYSKLAGLVLILFFFFVSVYSYISKYDKIILFMEFTNRLRNYWTK